MQIHRAAEQDDKKAILRELASGVAVDVRDSEDMTPLMRAVFSSESDVETVQLLLNQGADPNAVSSESESPVLWLSLIRGDPSRVQCLLEAGADVHFVSEGDLDALMVVSDEHYGAQSEPLLTLVDMLLERGISTVRESEDGLTALGYAFDRGNFGMVKRLLEVGADEACLSWTPLMRAVAVGTVDEVRELLKQGADIFEKEPLNERTPWLLAVSSGDTEKAELLLEAGADRNDIGWYEKTALFYPVETGDSEMLKWLLSIGCDVDASGEFGTTSMTTAAGENSLDLVQILLDAGANPDKKDRSDRKAIDYTSSLEIVHVLLPTGDDLSELKPEVRRLLFGTKNTISLTREDLEIGWNPRLGTANPERMDVALWRARVLHSSSY